MGVLFKDIKVGDEFYKLRNGKYINYEKCQVIRINKPDTIVYKIKGRSKNKNYWFKNRNIFAYTTKFFRKKDNLLFYIYKLLQGITFYDYEDFSKHVLLELDKFKRTKPQYFI
jgi:hypothetical protein